MRESGSVEGIVLGLLGQTYTCMRFYYVSTVRPSISNASDCQKHRLHQIENTMGHETKFHQFSYLSYFRFHHEMYVGAEGDDAPGRGRGPF